MLEILKSRSSIRKFKETPIPEETLNEVLESATYAPTGGNLQNYSIIVTKDEENRKALSDIHLNQSQIETAPVILTFCVDVRRNSDWLNQRGEESPFYNTWGFFLSFQDTMLSAQNAVTAAESLGLGSCFSGAALIRILSLIEFFECPKGVLPIATLALGWPDEIPMKRQKLPLKAIVHQEQYKAIDSEVINKLYQNKEAQDSKFYHNHQLGEIYTSKYPPHETPVFSENLQKALKQQGFYKKMD